MSVLYKVKGLFALLLALCLLLPLSQCSGISASDTGMSAAAVPASRNQYVFHDARDPLCWGGAAVLLAPLGVV